MHDLVNLSASIQCSSAPASVFECSLKFPKVGTKIGDEMQKVNPKSTLQDSWLISCHSSFKVVVFLCLCYWLALKRLHLVALVYYFLHQIKLYKLALQNQRKHLN